MQNIRKYQLWALSEHDTALNSDQFRQLVERRIIEAHKELANFECKILQEETSHDLVETPPPSQFLFYYTVEKNGNTKDHFNSKGLIDHTCRTDPDIRQTYVKRIYNWSPQ